VAEIRGPRRHRGRAFPGRSVADDHARGARRFLRPARGDAGDEREEGGARGALPKARRAGGALRRQDPAERVSHRLAGGAGRVGDREGVRAHRRRRAPREYVHWRHRRGGAPRAERCADVGEDGALHPLRLHAPARSRTTSTTGSARRSTPTAARYGSTRARWTTSRIAFRRSKRRRARSAAARSSTGRSSRIATASCRSRSSRSASAVAPCRRS